MPNIVLKMKFRLFAIVILLHFSGVLPAQTVDLNQALKTVDSLMYAESFGKADTALSSLEKTLVENKERENYLSLRLNTQLLRGSLFLEKDDIRNALNTVLPVVDQAKDARLYSIACDAHISLALIHEIASDLVECKKHLDQAFNLIKKHELDSLYGWYCLRMASYYHQANQDDSAIVYAYKALPYAGLYKNDRVLIDDYSFLGGLLRKTNPLASLKFQLEAVHLEKARKKFSTAAGTYSNISRYFFETGNMERSMMYNDSALYMHQLRPSLYIHSAWLIRSKIFEVGGNTDSALFYFKKYHEGYLTEMKNREVGVIKKISENYKLDKIETTVQSQRSSLIYILVISLLLAIASILLFRQNKRIKSQNKLINKQVDDLQKLLQQKEILLSELQHRVKNNLQQIISLLDIQKESVNYHNIEEVIRENQNRIMSMAILHNKLDLSSSTGDVNLDTYLQELCELMQTSYSILDNHVNLEVNSRVAFLPIDTASLLGLIVVELLSNGFKHAFENRKNGNITLTTFKNEYNKYELIYHDDGVGFDFAKTTSNGLGLELLKGLVNEINGIIESKQNNGTEIRIIF